VKAVSSYQEPWRISSAIDIDRVSLEDVKLIFSQAGKRLDDTVKTGENIASKTISMITLMAGVLIALSGFMLTDWKGWSSATPKDYVAIIGAFYILILFIFMIKNILSDTYFALGSEPHKLMIPQYFEAGIPQEKISIFIYMNEIENYDARIRSNAELNIRRLARYRFSTRSFLLLPMVLGVIFVLLECLV
jgi:hypothetical protein